MNPLATRRLPFVEHCLRASWCACLALWPMASVLAFAQAPAPSTASSVPELPALIDRGLPDESWLTRSSLFRYTQIRFAPISFADSPRSSLVPVDGVIHLSVEEAIALALENNLDIEAVRLLRPAAITDIQRTKSGLLPRSLPLSVLPGPSSASGPLAASSAGGVPTVSTSSLGLTNQLIGSAIPNTEPAIFATGRTFRNTDPVANPVLTGTNFLDTKETDVTLGVRKNWFTGTELTGQYESSRIAQNSPNNSLNPFLTGNLSLRIDQHLLQGFGRDTNMRAIRVAVNNRKMAELNIREQITITITQVLGLYYDLAAFTDQVKLLESASKQTMETLEQDKRRLDMGLVSSADVLQRQLALEREQQALSDARAQIREQELTLKNVLTRSGLENPALVDARIEPTDRFDPPPDEPAEQAARVADLAASRRADVQQGLLSVDNDRESLMGTRNALKPVFDVYLKFQNNALSGQLNRDASAGVVTGLDPGLIGGFGTLLSQMGQRTFPDYEFGFQLNVPIVNRAAQADMARDQIDLRQQAIAVQTLKNSIRLQAIKAYDTLLQAREQWQSSTRTRKLMEQSLDLEQRMLDFGTSDPARIANAEHDLELSRLREISTLASYARATVNLQAILDQTVEVHHVVIDAKPVSPAR